MPEFRPHRALRLRRWAAHARTLAVVYFLLLAIGTHLPVPPETIEVLDYWDKLVHFSGYAMLTIVVLSGWELTIGQLQAKHYFAVWLAGTLYGIFDETTQTYVGRTCDMNDWAADVLGIVVGLVAFRLLSALVRRALATDEAKSAVQQQPS